MTDTSESEAKREGSHPYDNLPRCLEIGEVVKRLGGDRSSVPKGLIAKELGLEEDGAGLGQRISSAKAFGVIEGRGAFRLTDDGNKYFFPENDQEKRIALCAFFSRPPAFAALIQRFNGNLLPESKTIANILTRDKLAKPSWAMRVAQIFNRSAHEAGVLDGSGILRFKATLQGIGTPERQEHRDNAVGKPQDRPTGHAHRTAGAEQVYQFGGVVLEILSGFSLSDWNRLNKIVRAIKPGK